MNFEVLSICRKATAPSYGLREPPNSFAARQRRTPSLNSSAKARSKTLPVSRSSQCCARSFGRRRRRRPAALPFFKGIARVGSPLFPTPSTSFFEVIFLRFTYSGHPGAPRDFIGRAELDRALQDPQAEDVFRIVRVSSTGDLRDVKNGERRSARLRVGEAHEVTAP